MISQLAAPVAAASEQKCILPSRIHVTITVSCVGSGVQLPAKIKVVEAPGERRFAQTDFSPLHHKCDASHNSPGVSI
jgi:hypothetical protein